MIDTVVKINSATVIIKGNPTLERNVKEELDIGKLVIESTREKRYEMYDKVDVTTPYNVDEQYLVQADNPVQLNATEYQHNLTLFENIAFFNTIYPADRSFKVIGQTLEDILTTYKRELEAYHNIIITWTTIPQAVLDEVIPFKEFAGINLSIILLSLMRKIWAVPKVNRVGVNWDIYPLYHNEKNNSISKDSISKMSQQNNVDYATQVKSQLKNAVNERLVDEVSWFPSESGYVLPRSSSLEKITSKLRYELDSNIITILQGIAVGVEYTIYNTVTTNIDTLFIDVDITTNIIQDEAWDLLPVITSTAVGVIDQTDNVKNHVRYKVGQPYITNLFESSSDGIIFKFDTYYLRWAIMREVEKNTATYFDPTYYTGSNPAIQPLATEDVKMRFKYIKQRNIDLTHIRKTKGSMNDTTTIHQQRDASVEINEYKKNMKLYSNRMGNKENSKTKVFTYPDEPYELFDYTDEKTIVTRVQNTYHNLFVYCEYEESESFGNIEAEYALMRRSDPYTINSKSVTTNLIVQELIEISEISRPLDTRFTSDARRLLNGLFEATTIPFDKVAVGVFKPVLASWNNSYAIHMPVEVSGDGNLITIHVQFPHQTIAGKTYYDLDTDTYKIYLNPLAYTKVSDPPELDDGTLTNYELYFTPDILFEDAGQYPLILSETLYLASAYTDDGIIEPIDLDTAASFAVTLQASFVADEHIYIGNAMASSNYFVKDQATTTAIKIYTSTKPYGQYDQAPRSYDTDNTATISYVYSFANRTITITPTNDMDYFCIVKDGAILIAVNKPISAGTAYVLNVNHLSETVELATVETSVIVSVSANVITVAQVAQVFATEGIVSVAVEIATYQKINQAVAVNVGVSTTADVVYITKVNLPVEAEAITTISASLEYYTERDIGQALEAITTVSATLDYYAVRDIEYDTEAITTVTASMNYYRMGDLEKAFDADVAVTVEVNTTASLNPEPVEWVEIGAGTPTGGNCIVLADLGNIKEVDTSYCSFTNNGSNYESATDESTQQPACQEGAEYTLCLLFGETWYCQDYIGGEVEDSQLYECQLK
jgi:hypothetical protein